MDLSSIINYGFLIPGLISAIRDAVLLFEVPGETGADKSKKVIAYIEGLLPQWLPGNHTAEDIGKALAAVQPLIDLYVHLFNKPGGPLAPPQPVPVPAPAPVVEDKAQLVAHIANMKRRLSDALSGNDPDKDGHVANLTKNIEAAEARLAELK